VLEELDLQSAGVVAEHLGDAPAGFVLAEPGRRSTVDPQLRTGGNDVDLGGGGHHRRRQRHLEHRLDQDTQRGCLGADRVERGADL